MAKYIDPGIAEKITKLEEELRAFNRQTSRDYFLLVVPTSPDEEVTASLNGKPCLDNCSDPIEDIVAAVLMHRRNVEKGIS